MQEANFALKASDPHSQKAKATSKRLADYQTTPKMTILSKNQPHLTLTPTQKSENAMEEMERPPKADLPLFFCQ